MSCNENQFLPLSVFNRQPSYPRKYKYNEIGAYHETK